MIFFQSVSLVLHGVGECAWRHESEVHVDRSVR